MAELALKEHDAQDILVESIEDPRVAGAGVFLIGQHRRGNPVKLEALGRPQDALVSLSEQLESLGATHEMKVEFIEALRRYLVARGAEFSRAASAKPVYLSLEVADGLPDCRFENSLTEVTCIGTEGIKVQGVSGQNVRATISGTATTSNAADVDAMFANVQGLRLWFRCEAPTKEDLDGLMTAMDSALAGVAQAVGGSLSAEDFKNLLETLEAQNALTPQMEELIASLIALQKSEELGLSEAQIGELVQNISALMAEAQDTGLIPPVFIEAATKALGELSSDEVIRDFLVEHGFEDLVASNDNALGVEEQIAQIMGKIEALQSVEGLDPALIAELTALAESMKEQLARDNPDPSAILDSLSEKLMDIAAREDVPQALFDGIGDILPALAEAKEAVVTEATMTAPSLENAETMLALLEDIAAKIEAGEVLPEDVPPEIMEVIEQLGGVEVLTQEQGREARLDAVAAAIEAPEGSDMGIAMAAAIDVLSDPAMVEQLPPALQESVQAVLESSDASDHTAISLDTASAPEQNAEMDFDGIRPSVHLSETFANPTLTQPATADAPPRTSAIGSPALFGMGAGGSSPSFSGAETAGGFVAPPSNPASPPPSASVEDKAPDIAPQPKDDGAEQEKKNDKIVVLPLPKTPVDVQPKEKDPVKDAEAKKPAQPTTETPDAEPPANPPEKSPDVPKPDNGPCGDDCKCKPEFNNAAGDVPPAPEVLITPEVQQMVKEISPETLVKFGGSEAVEKTIQEIMNNDPQTLKDKTIEEVLIQTEKKERVIQAIKEDKPVVIENKDRDERKTQQLIEKRNRKMPELPSGPIDLKAVHGHACGPGCGHEEAEIATQSSEQASEFSGKRRAPRKGKKDNGLKLQHS